MNLFKTKKQKEFDPLYNPKEIYYNTRKVSETLIYYRIVDNRKYATIICPTDKERIGIFDINKVSLLKEKVEFKEPKLIEFFILKKEFRNCVSVLYYNQYYRNCKLMENIENCLYIDGFLSGSNLKKCCALFY